MDRFRFQSSIAFIHHSSKHIIDKQILPFPLFTLNLNFRAETTCRNVLERVGKHEGEERVLCHSSQPLFWFQRWVWTSDWTQQRWLRPRVWFFFFPREVQVIVKDTERWVHGGARPDGIWHSWKDTAEQKGISGIFTKHTLYIPVQQK